jgi:hypothetical protein
VRFRPVTVAREPDAETTSTADAGRSRARRAGIHGRVGVRYLVTRDGLNERADFTSPGIDARIDAPSLYGSPWSVYLDVRARRVTTTGTDGRDVDDDRNRVYRASFGWDRPGPGWRFAAGRQVAPELANVSMFDGVSAAWDGSRWSGGGFAGTQPDGADWGFSSDIAEGGGWVGVRSKSASEKRWSINAGAVASRADGEVNREFMFVQGRYGGPRITLYATQEVDINRDWKKDEAGESAVEPTSSFVLVRVRATDAIDLVGGYDNRRNVRLYRDRITPATEFDDSFRQGVWAGVRARVARYVRFGVSGRSSDGGSAGTATAFTGDVSLVQLTSAGIAVGLRATRWDNDRLEGGLYTAFFSVDPLPFLGLTVETGVRDEQSLLNSGLDDTVLWAGVDLDLELGAGFWATLSLERSEGDFEEVDQGYATIAWRF